MADLADPVVTVLYDCGCSFVDDTPLDGIVVPAGIDPEGNPYPQRTLAKNVAYRFGADEVKVWGKLREIRERLQAGTLDRDDLVRWVELLLGRNLTPAQETRVRTATLAQLKERLYDELLEQTKGLPPRTKDPVSGVTFPQPPATCPRHDRPAVHVHSSYLSPS